MGYDPSRMGYNPARDVINAFAAKELQMIGQINHLNDELTELTDELALLQELLSHLSSDTNGSKRVDWRGDPEKMALVDAVRDNPATAHLFEPGVYLWKDEKLTQLTERVNQYINRVISPTIQQKMTEITQKQYENNEIIEIVTTMVKECNELIRRIQANIQRAR